MTIRERPVLASLRLQTFNIGEAAPFILDYSRLDVATLGDGTENAEAQWTDWTPHLLQVDTMRGGRQDGLTVVNDTGVLTATLYGVPLGFPAPNFLAGQRIRLQHVSGLGIRRDLYNGRILDVIPTTTLDRRGNLAPVIQINAVDNYVNHDTTTRYGALPAGGAETFAERIARLAQTATAPIEPPTLHRAPTYTPWVEERRNLFDDPAPASIAAPASGMTRWFRNSGSSAQVALDPDGWVRIYADSALTDATAARASNWAGNGKTVSAETTYTLSFDQEKAAGLGDLRLAWWAYTAAGVGIGGERIALPQVADSGRVYYTFTTPANAERIAFVVRRNPQSAWVAGDWYRIRRTRLALGMDATYFDGATEPGGELERTRWLGPPNASASVLETREFAGWSPLPDVDEILGRTVYESSVANHLTLACNTAGALWWVGADNVTRFAPREFDPYTALTFVGPQLADEPAGALHYIRPIISAGSRAFFNRAIMHNHGAQLDLDNGDWIANDVDVTTLHLGGIYGISDVDIDTNHASNPAADPHIYDWLVPSSNFVPKATGIVWNAQEDLDRVPDVEIGRSVYLPTDDISRDPWPWNQIIGVRHVITPTRWMTEITLIGVQQQ